MRTSSLRAGLAGLALAAVAGLGCLAGGAAATSHDQTVLRIGVFGDFGYTDLYRRFEAAHPGVTIKEDVRGGAEHHSRLIANLRNGSGAADVEAIEVGYIARLTAQPRYFVDLRAFGASARKPLYLPWKWAQGVARNGSVVGLGTDIGSLAICYRRDDFAKAGLPTNREAVGRLWPTWKDFIRVGERFQAHAPNGLHFFDGGANVFGAIVAQARPAYYSSTGRVIVDTNPKVKEAWDTTMLGIRAGESASFGRFSMDWDKGFQSGIFATITCPAWMMGYIQGLAPKAAGKWDIATPPGDGGNWGGSFLAVPRQSQHQELAAELAKFLTSPASELYVFKQTGNLPSLTALLRRPEVQKLRSKYFHNAPVGEIFAASALRLEPQAVGARQGDIQNAAAVAVSRVEHGNMSARASWAQFLKDVRALR